MGAFPSINALLSPKGYAHNGSMEQLLELLLHNARETGSILTVGTVCVEFAHSHSGLHGFPPGALNSSHIPKMSR